MSSETTNDQPEQPAGNACGAEPCGNRATECPEMYLAAEAVRLAKAEFEKAQKLYEDLRRQAEDKIKSVRATTVGEVIDKTLVAVKRNPGASLVASVALGFCMGRWVQKIFKR